MRRSLVLAIGIFIVLLGIQCLGVEKFVTRDGRPLSSAIKKEYVVQDYTPFSMIGIGAVIIIYAYDLPKRLNN
jgi:hypothetical protein